MTTPPTARTTRPASTSSAGAGAAGCACCRGLIVVPAVALALGLFVGALTFALFLVLLPIQERLMSFQHKRRQKANIYTDGRANLILEVLGGMRIVKYFSYEVPFLKRESAENSKVDAVTN